MKIGKQLHSGNLQECSSVVIFCKKNNNNTNKHLHPPDGLGGIWMEVSLMYAS